jgi:hypothetical protein
VPIDSIPGDGHEMGKESEGKKRKQLTTLLAQTRPSSNYAYLRKQKTSNNSNSERVSVYAKNQQKENKKQLERENVLRHGGLMPL